LIAKGEKFNHIELHSKFLDEFLVFFLELIEKSKINFSVHMPHMYSKEKVNLCSAVKKDKEKACYWLKKSIHLSKELNAKYIILHPDVPKKCSKEKGREVLEKHIKDNMNLLKKNQMFLIENMPSKDYCISNVEEMKEFLKKFDKSKVGCVWDIAHSYFVMKDRFLQFPKVLEKSIKEIHICDFGKNGEDHLVLSKGIMNIKKIGNSIKKFKVPLILEIKPENIDDISNSRKILKKYF